MLEISADVVSRRGRGPKYSDRMRRVVDSLKPFALFLKTAAKIAMHEVLLVDQKKKRFFFLRRHEYFVVGILAFFMISFQPGEGAVIGGRAAVFANLNGQLNQNSIYIPPNKYDKIALFFFFLSPHTL